MKSVKFSDVGIHSGIMTSVVVKPSKKPGIFFSRVDLPGAKLIPATWDNVQNTGLMSTSIGIAPNQVQTIEHFMAALFICGIDSAIIEIDGPEFPILDGGAKSFIEILEPIANYKNKSKQIIVKKEIIATRQEIIKQMPLLKRLALWIHGIKTGRKEDGFVKLSPDKRGFLMDVTLDYPDKIIGIQSAKFRFNGTDSARKEFIKHFSHTRTFGRIWEWEYLKKRGMGLGANENNVIAINENGDGVLNKLHCPDEFVRHKLIDALGDFYTSGGMIVGHLDSVKGSHALNNLVLRKLFADSSNYEIKESRI